MRSSIAKRGSSSSYTTTESDSDNCDESSTAKKVKRQLTVATFEKWQRLYEQEHQTLTWLRCKRDRSDSTVVESLFCEVCKTFEDNIHGMRNFSSTWISGSTNLRASNMIDHAGSDQHKAAMRRLHVNNAKAASQSIATYAPIAKSLLNMEASVKTKMKKKFDICYLMAKEGMGFEKFPALHELQSRHGVSIGSTYVTPQSAKLFTHYIALAQREGFISQLSVAKFYSFLMDGSTDAGNIEQELVLISFCRKDDSARKVRSCTKLLSLLSPEKADADGLLKCLSNALQPLGVTDVLDQVNVIGVSGKPVLVGGGTDGASVNIAQHSGMRGKMQSALPWLMWSWCYAHRLELACKGALTSTLFKDIEEMLLRLYYLYHKSPKKCRDLVAVIDDLKEVFELPNGGNLPIRSQGSRWINHKRKALLRVIDRYGAYVSHLSTLTEDTSLKSEDRARIKGYLAKWMQYRTVLGCALYVDILKPAAILSLCLQDSELDVVAGIKSILKSSASLKNLSKTEPTEWPTVKLVQGRISLEGEDKVYQGTYLSNYNTSSQKQSIQHALNDLQTLNAKMQERLEWSDVQLLRSLLAFLETQNWAVRSTVHGTDTDVNEMDDLTDVDSSLVEVKRAAEHIITHFRVPLESKGVLLATIQDEVEEIVHYGRKYLDINKLDYREAWYKLLSCPDAQKWANVASLCELAFSLPFSNGRVEQIFSSMKLIKTDRRTNLRADTMNDLLEIYVEGPPFSAYSADRAVELWWTDCSTTRRVNQTLPRKEYRPRANSTSEDDHSTGKESETSLTTSLEDWDEWLFPEHQDVVTVEDDDGDS